MNKKILIIDDEPALLKALVDKFTRAGFEVIIAEDGQEGLKAAFRNKPDLILLDIIMPNMDGITMLCELRKNPWGKKVKVILLTNLSDPIKLTESLTQPVAGYLIKSNWKINDVVDQVYKELMKK